MSTRIFCLLVVCMCYQNVHGLYFVLRQKMPQCFIIDQPAETPVIVSYSIKDRQSAEVTITARSKALGPKGMKQVVEEIVRAEEGHFEFTLQADGEHTICAMSKDMTEPIRVQLSIDYGQDKIYYELLAKQSHMDELQLEVTILNDEMSMILNEADYMKDKEVMYHHQTERVNMAAQWWPMLQLVILLVTGVFQVQYLKQFFKNNKLI